MKLANIHIQKIRDMLKERMEKIKNDLGGKAGPLGLFPGHSLASRSFEQTWLGYLNGIDCEVLDEDEARDEFEDLFNHSAQTRICVSFFYSYILVPKELAEKALALGGLPDHFCPESSEDLR